LRSGAVQLESVYTLRPEDPEAFYFTDVKADGKTDVSEALQAAINRVKREKNFGILFIPEGKYLISKTIYIPGAIRLIGYGRKRPEFILARNSPGFQQEVPDDKGKASCIVGCAAMRQYFFRQKAAILTRFSSATSFFRFR
jgi:hypothetical protein